MRHQLWAQRQHPFEREPWLSQGWAASSLVWRPIVCRSKDLQAADLPTLAQTLEEYGRRPNAAIEDSWQTKPITSTKVQGRPFGEWRIAEITRETLEAFQRQRPRVAGNRNLALLKAMFNWAVVAGLVESSPFRIGGVTVVRLRAETARSRRLVGDEEDRLLTESRGLHDIIIGALETGCRLGELLSLQWHQVRFSPRAELFLPAQKTKARKDRRVPISDGSKGFYRGAGTTRLALPCHRRRSSLATR